MYFFKIAKNVNESRWYKNGGKDIINAFLNGNIDGINADGTFSKILSDDLTKGIDLVLEHSHRVFTTPRPFDIGINDFDGEQGTYIYDDYKIEEGMTWGVISDIEAMELLTLCYRVKAFDMSLVFFRIFPSCHLKIIQVRNYDDFYSYEDKCILDKYCVDSNGHGAFVYFESFYEPNEMNPKTIPELEKFKLSLEDRSYSEPEWMMLKYFI